MYLVSGYTYGERIVHRPDLRPDLGRWLERKHTPRFRVSAGSGILPLPLKGVGRLDTSVKRVQRLYDIADEVVICHPTRTERNVRPLAHSKNDSRQS